MSFTQIFTDELCGKTFLRIKSCVFVLLASTVLCNYKFLDASFKCSLLTLCFFKSHPSAVDATINSDEWLGCAICRRDTDKEGNQIVLCDQCNTGKLRMDRHICNAFSSCHAYVFSFYVHTTQECLQQSDFISTGNPAKRKSTAKFSSATILSLKQCNHFSFWIKSGSGSMKVLLLVLWSGISAISRFHGFMMTAQGRNFHCSTWCKPC